MLHTLLLTGLPPPVACRDECSDQGMLMVALDVLMRVHGAVMRALGSPPQLLPSGEAVARGWDVRHALTQEREKVRMSCSVCT